MTLSSQIPENLRSEISQAPPKDLRPKPLLKKKKKENYKLRFGDDKLQICLKRNLSTHPSQVNYSPEKLLKFTKLKKKKSTLNILLYFSCCSEKGNDDVIPLCPAHTCIHFIFHSSKSQERFLQKQKHIQCFQKLLCNHEKHLCKE